MFTGVYIALIKNNAHVGAAIAVALASFREMPSFQPVQESLPAGRTILRENQVVVIGGSVIDIISQSSQPLITPTSNPGQVIQRWGGVARNVAEMLTRLGTKPVFVSAVGEDMYAQILMNYCLKVGIVKS